MFREKKSLRIGYTQQGYIYFCSRRYREMPRAKQREIQKLCIKAGGSEEVAEAVLQYVTTDMTATQICMQHYISRSTLDRAVRRYYKIFPKWF